MRKDEIEETPGFIKRRVKFNIVEYIKMLGIISFQRHKMCSMLVKHLQSRRIHASKLRDSVQL